MAKLRNLDEKESTTFWLYCSTRMTMDLQPWRNETIYVQKAKGHGVSPMEQWLVGYAGPSALDECIELVVPLKDAENGPQRKTNKSQICLQSK